MAQSDVSALPPIRLLGDAQTGELNSSLSIFEATSILMLFSCLAKGNAKSILRTSYASHFFYCNS
jgi:hypothetical protein